MLHSHLGSMLAPNKQYSSCTQVIIDICLKSVHAREAAGARVSMHVETECDMLARCRVLV